MTGNDPCHSAQPLCLLRIGEINRCRLSGSLLRPRVVLAGDAVLGPRNVRFTTLVYNFIYSAISASRLSMMSCFSEIALIKTSKRDCVNGMEVNFLVWSSVCAPPTAECLAFQGPLLPVSRTHFSADAIKRTFETHISKNRGRTQSARTVPSVCQAGMRPSDGNRAMISPVQTAARG